MDDLVIEEILNHEEWMRRDLIKKMDQLGWTVTDGKVVHPEELYTFDTWYEAIVYCVTRGSQWEPTD